MKFRLFFVLGLLFLLVSSIANAQQVTEICKMSPADIKAKFGIEVKKFIVLMKLIELLKMAFLKMMLVTVILQRKR